MSRGNRSLENVFTPWVMRAAWNKTQSWYRAGEMYDPGEMLAWQADPWGHLAELTSELVSSQYRPRPFPLVPFPKKGDSIRHYVVPSVRDQVAFMAFLTVLGPFFEARMFNVSFGNRLFRPRVQTVDRRIASPHTSGEQHSLGSSGGEPVGLSGDQMKLFQSQSNDAATDATTATSQDGLIGDGSSLRWRRAPFSLNQTPVYDGFSTGYGLFRRLSQWIVNRSVFGPGFGSSFGEVGIREEDPDLLPYLDDLNKNLIPADLISARLDLSLAYPSVDRDALGNYIVHLLRTPSSSEELSGWGRPTFPDLRLRNPTTTFESSVEGGRPMATPHPWDILRENEALRLQVGKMLSDALKNIVYAPWEEPPGWFEAGKAMDDFAQRWNDGVEDAFKRHLNEKEMAGHSDNGDPKGSKSEQWEDDLDPGGVWPLGAHLPQDLLNEHRFGLPTGLAISGLLLNVALNPVDASMTSRYEEALRKQETPVIYLRFADDMLLFSRCERALERSLRHLHELLRSDDNHLSRHFRLSIEKAEPASVKRFLTQLDEGEDVGTLRLRPPLAEWYTRGRAEPFTTPVVRELSGLAHETLEDRFGFAGLERLERLMDLAEGNDGDFQVADDARLSFAVNKMALATWPTHSVREAKGDFVDLPPKFYVYRMRTVAENALRQHPWRFKLWRALIIIAYRSSTESHDCHGMAWLRDNLLPLIRWSSPPNGSALPPGSSRSELSWEMAGTSDVFEQDVTSTDRGPARLAADEADALGVAPNFLATVDKRRTDYRRLRTSFHRAWFWRQWAGCVRALQRRVSNHSLGRITPGWTSHLDVEDARKFVKRDVLKQEFQSIVKRLYGSAQPDYWSDSDPFLWWWEAEALWGAMLALSEPSPTLLRRLGNPVSETLRRSATPGLMAVANNLLPKRNRRFGDIRRALANVLTYDRKGVSPSCNKGDAGRRALLWVRKLAIPEMGRDAKHPLAGSLRERRNTTMLPRKRRDALDWAALARIGLWDELPELVMHADGSMQPPDISVNGFSRGAAQLWRRIQTLDAYHFVRRLRQAHGQTPVIGDFPGWFDTFLPVRQGTKESQGVRTLQDAMYRLHDDGRTLADGMVPALETPAVVAWPVIQHSRDLQTSIVTPDTLSAADEFLDQLNKFRLALVMSRDAPGQEPPRSDASGSNRREVAIPLFERLAFMAGELESKDIQLLPLTNKTRAPHALYFLPEVVATSGSARLTGKAHQWRLALLYLWMTSGGEAVLNNLYWWAPWQPSLYDRDLVRGQLMLDENSWEFVEQALGTTKTSTRRQELYDGNPLPPRPTLSGTGRIHHIRFGGGGGGHWVVDLAEDDAPGNVQPGNKGADYLRVRLVQGKMKPSFAEVFSRQEQFLVWGRSAVADLSEEIVSHLYDVGTQGRYGGASRRREQLVVFPEWYVPDHYRRDLHKFVQKTGTAVLAGLLPRELPRTVPVTAEIRHQGLRCMVNEAVLVLPGLPTDQPGKEVGQENPASPAVPRVFEFRIRKPYASVNELGLIQYLNDRAALAAAERRWVFVPGMTWQIFGYYAWGNFSVAICSDVLDTFVWDRLRGRIQHLFVPSWNQDIELFDQVTRTRGYELYANVVTVNHGSMGGSVVWTPKSGHAKEVFRVRGAGMGLGVTVDLPVKSLIEAQRRQWGRSIEGRKAWWAKQLGGKGPDDFATKKKDKNKFKPPPPDYPRITE